MTLNPSLRGLDLRTLRYWFTPTWSGDFRLLRLDDGTCELTAVDPTADEKAVLGRLLEAARANHWCGPEAGIADRGETRIVLRTSIANAGPLVSGSVHGDAALWTAVRTERGQVIVVSDLPRIDAAASAGSAVPVVDMDAAPTQENPAGPPLGWGRYAECPKCVAAPGSECLHQRTFRPMKNAHPGRPLTAAAQAALTAVIEAAKPPAAAEGGAAVAAASVRPPYQGCPAPTKCNRRASAVLRSFSTEKQWASWTRRGSMGLIGSRTGRAYDLFHRDEAADRGLTHVLVERRTGDAVCVWDDRVPPEEEALAVKLAVEHREGWLRRLPRGPAKLSAMDAAYREDWSHRGGGNVIPVIASTPYSGR